MLNSIGQIVEHEDHLEIEKRNYEVARLNLELMELKVEEFGQVSRATHQENVELSERIQEMKLLAEQQQRCLEQKTSEAEQHTERLAELDASGAVLLLVENVELTERIQEMDRLAAEQHQQLQDMKKAMEFKTNLLQAIKARVRRWLEVLPCCCGRISCSCSWSFQSLSSGIDLQGWYACLFVSIAHFVLFFVQPLVMYSLCLMVGLLVIYLPAHTQPVQ